MLSLGQISTALPAQIFRLMDVFICNNLGTVAVVTNYWDSSQITGTISTITAGNPTTLTATNTASLNVGDLIGIAGVTGTIGSDSKSGLNGRIFYVRQTSPTFQLETGNDTTGLSGSGGTWYRIPTARSTGLTYQNGCYLQTGSLQNLYIGTMMVGALGTTGRADDNTSSRLVWNYFNRLPKYMTCSDPGPSWVYSTNIFRPRDKSTLPGVGRMEFVTGIVEEPVSGSCIVLFQNTTTAGHENAISLNHVDGSGTVLGILRANEPLAGANTGAQSANSSAYPALGYTFAQSVEKAFGGTATWMGTSTDPAAATCWMNGRW
jgi:hypothetical protein